MHPQIDLGGGHVLEFVMAPNLHWPDTMFTFDHATNVMYTCEGPRAAKAVCVCVRGGRLSFRQAHAL